MLHKKGNSNSNLKLKKYMYLWFVCLFIPYLRLSETAYEDNNKNTILSILRDTNPHAFIIIVTRSKILGS